MLKILGGPFGALAFLCVLVIGIAGLVIATAPPQPRPPTPVALATPTPMPTTVPTPLATRAPTATSLPPRPKTGTEARITTNLQQPRLMIDDAAMDDWTKAVTANDIAGLREIIAARRAFPVENGTRVLVLGQEFTRTRVRVLEGPQEGRTGITYSEDVR